MDTIVELKDFGPEVGLWLFLTLLLLMVSALASGSETSLFSLTHNDIHALKERRNSSSEAILKLLKSVDLLLATILVLNNLVNICIVILSSRLIDTLFSSLRIASEEELRRSFNA